MTKRLACGHGRVEIRGGFPKHLLWNAGVDVWREGLTVEDAPLGGSTGEGFPKKNP